MRPARDRARLNTGIATYVRIVANHQAPAPRPGAWIDAAMRDPKKGQVGHVGYEINFNRYFYRYTPPRPLEEIEADIFRMLAEVTGAFAAG